MLPTRLLKGFPIRFGGMCLGSSKCHTTRRSKQSAESVGRGLVLWSKHESLLIHAFFSEPLERLSRCQIANALIGNPTTAILPPPLHNNPRTH